MQTRSSTLQEAAAQHMRNPHSEARMMQTSGLTLPATQGEIQALQAQINSLSEQMQTLRTLGNAATPFRRLFDNAHVDPRATARLLMQHVRHCSPAVLLEVAKLCLNGPVGQVGDRNALRAVAILICDEILRRVPGHADAMCLKGEALLPFIHYGKNTWNVPRSVLQEAYNLFDAASKDGNKLAMFLKGRWLLSMEPLHRDRQQAQLGVACVKAAADKNCSRALVFLAHRYEYPELDRTVSFAADLPKGKAQREKFILGFYQRAADMGDADALNDIGTSYAEGYGGLECDFDKAVEYYERAIEQGSLHAFDNLGTHFETGMAGRFTHRVDFRKALYYYRQGARKRCPKCAYNLAAAHEEGMHAVLPRDSKKAENYYWLAMELAEDANDAHTSGKSIKDLSALYITRIKLNPPGGDIEKDTWKRLLGLIGDERSIRRAMVKVDKAIATAGRGRTGALSKLLGDLNCKLIVRHLKALEDDQEERLVEHVLGGKRKITRQGGGAKKRRR